MIFVCSECAAVPGVVAGMEDQRDQRARGVWGKVPKLIPVVRVTQGPA